MKHVMVDLETLGTNPDCAFISIGACIFNPETGEIDKINSFYRRISWKDAIKKGRSVDADTLHWWFQQSESARIEACKRGEPLDQVLNDFQLWFPLDGIIWGNGATFDVSILQNAYKNSPPWNFWNIMDVRTICAISDIDKKTIPFDGVPHYALDDALHQAKYVSLMWQKLKHA